MVLVAAAVSHLSGQEPPKDRSKLVEPVYVSKSTDLAPLAPTATPSGTSQKGTRPILEKEVVAAEAKPTPPPATEGPAEKFARVLSDAEVSLEYIRQNIDDYTCTFVKRELVNGRDEGYQQIKAKVRNRKVVDGKVVVPFSVYMKFVKPSSMRGREVLYVEGANNGKLLGKEGGTKGRFLPAVWLPPDCKFAMKGQRYDITEFGLENLTQRLIDRGGAETQIDVCQVKYQAGAKVAGRPCRFLEVRRDQPKAVDDGAMNVFLVRVFTDEQLNIPIRYVAYDWPKDGASPQVIEEYSYLDLKVNVGLSDDDFDHKNPDYGF